MGVDIHISAHEVWAFFQENKDRLAKEMVVIAENTDTKYAVYLTEEDGYPLFSVCKGSAEPEYEEGAINEQDCTQTAAKCYRQYLFPVIVSKEKAVQQYEDDLLEGEAESEQEPDCYDTIYEREDELQLALCDFLQVALQEYEEGRDIADIYGQAMIDEVLDHVLEYLGLEQCLPIYRPMFVTDEETGEEVYTEYPYGEWEFVEKEQDEG